MGHGGKKQTNPRRHRCGGVESCPKPLIGFETRRGRGCGRRQFRAGVGLTASAREFQFWVRLKETVRGERAGRKSGRERPARAVRASLPWPLLLWRAERGAWRRTPSLPFRGLGVGKAWGGQRGTEWAGEAERGRRLAFPFLLPAPEVNGGLLVLLPGQRLTASERRGGSRSFSAPGSCVASAASAPLAAPLSRPLASSSSGPDRWCSSAPPPPPPPRKSSRAERKIGGGSNSARKTLVRSASGNPFPSWRGPARAGGGVEDGRPAPHPGRAGLELSASCTAVGGVRCRDARRPGEAFFFRAEAEAASLPLAKKKEKKKLLRRRKLPLVKLYPGAGARLLAIALLFLHLAACVQTNTQNAPWGEWENEQRRHFFGKFARKNLRLVTFIREAAASGKWGDLSSLFFFSTLETAAVVRFGEKTAGQDHRKNVLFFFLRGNAGVFYERS